MISMTSSHEFDGGDGGGGKGKDEAGSPSCSSFTVAMLQSLYFNTLTTCRSYCR